MQHLPSSSHALPAFVAHFYGRHNERKSQSKTRFMEELDCFMSRLKKQSFYHLPTTKYICSKVRWDIHFTTSNYTLYFFQFSGNKRFEPSSFVVQNVYLLQLEQVTCNREVPSSNAISGINFLCHKMDQKLRVKWINVRVKWINVKVKWINVRVKWINKRVNWIKTKVKWTKVKVNQSIL